MNQGNIQHRQSGFTIIELSLAMAFISALLLTIAMTIIQIGAIYNRGTLVKDANQIARLVNDDIRRTIGSGAAFSPSEDYKEFESIGGRLCNGSYTYIWNYGAAGKTGTNVTRYQSGGVKEGTAVHLVKVSDRAKAYCAVNASGNFTLQVIRIADQQAAAELLEVGERNIALHTFTVTSGVEESVSGQRLYSFAFSLGTNDQTALKDDDVSGKRCLEPGEPGADPLYCTVQDFTAVVRTGNKIGGAN